MRNDVETFEKKFYNEAFEISDDENNDFDEVAQFGQPKIKSAKFPGLEF